VYDVAKEEGVAVREERRVKSEEKERASISKNERYEKQKELKRAISRVEKQLDALEEERSGIMKLFTQDPAKFDLERTKRLSTLEAMIQHTEAEWSRLTEELVNIEK
jgi:hypothetical protein